MHQLYLNLSLVLGLILGAASLYVGLRLGFNFGVALLTVFCWSMLQRVLLRLAPDLKPLSDADLACHQSFTSAMSYSSGTVMATALGALFLIEVPLETVPTAIWLASICVLGSLLALPLRRALLARLPFPSGRAAAETARGILQVDRFKSFAPALFGSAGLTLLVQQLPTGFRSIGFVSLSPMLLGLGALLGSAAYAMALGGLFFFGLPGLQTGGLLAESSVPWFAVGIMLAAGGWELVGFLKPRQEACESLDRPSRLWWFAVAATMCVTLVSGAFLGLKQPTWMLPMIAALPLFVFVSCRVTGETDVVPIGALGKLALLMFGLLLSSYDTQSALLATAVLAGVAAAAADFSTDMRCGKELGCPPQRQLKYQVTGAIIGPLALVPFFFWLTSEVAPIGSEELPAPAAQIWLDIAMISFREAVFWGRQGPALMTGLVLGLLWTALYRNTAWGNRWLPQPLAFATAAYLDLSTVLTLACGAFLAQQFKKQNDIPLWSALLAGESITQVFILSAIALF